MRLERAVEAPERMDAPDVDPTALRAALDHIVAVNRWLGARRALLKHLPWGLPAESAGNPAGSAAGAGRSRPDRVLDIGTGAADLAAAIDRWARRRRRRVHVVGLDLHAATLAAARERHAGLPLVRGDGLRLPFPDATFDLVHLGMTLHHMDGPDLTTLLRESARVARGGRILVGELERAMPNYLGARLLAATVWRSNPVTRHDGPLSVLRSFTPGELRDLADAAGLHHPSVHRHPFFRLVLRAEA